MEQFALNFGPVRRIYSVSELNTEIGALLGTEFDNIWVSGEISGTKTLGSGHCYFTLKERDSQIRCALFKGTMRFLRFKPQDGVAVLARGRIDVFAARGEYQLIIDSLEPQGHGALQLAFEQLKKKLGAEGLFDNDRKRPMPRYPSRIAIVTSPRGAVISDMVRVFERRFPGLHIRLFPALVQGEGAVDDVVRGVDLLSRSQWPEVIIIARGGGSLEDLWTFNEERVARAIAKSSVPVISAIGHETDFTIADFVADLRAPTPSAAAELVICTKQELTDRVEGSVRRLTLAIRYKLEVLHRRAEQGGAGRSITTLQRMINRNLQVVDDKETRLSDAVRRLVTAAQIRRIRLEERIRFLDVRPRLERDRNRLHRLQSTSLLYMQLTLAAKRRRWETQLARLEQLSPLRVLDRGYAIVLDKSGTIVKDAEAVATGTPLAIRLARGILEAESK